MQKSGKMRKNCCKCSAVCLIRVFRFRFATLTDRTNLILNVRKWVFHTLWKGMEKAVLPPAAPAARKKRSTGRTPWKGNNE